MPVTEYTRHDYTAKTLSADFATAGTTDPIALSSNVALAVTGTATAVEIIVERSARDPEIGAKWVKVGASITGNPSTGMDAQAFLEAGVAWWRARVVTLTGGNLSLDITGGGTDA